MVSIQLSRIGTKEALALMAGARAETPRHSVNGETASDRIADRHSDDSLHVSHVHHFDKSKKDILLKTGRGYRLRREGGSLGVDGSS